ncbi:hypothetical protein QYE76_021767 [Lolium multiflorum]|uniref:Uncharacterized protein n=1 Tax=Lolium multiflorum TaxID=4521 RepID=A0AAD8VT72_LOLMU|nr:hypothetical protein QYE76_021767 [Lolium multiflorum]
MAVPLWYRFTAWIQKVWTLLLYLKCTSTELWRIIEEGYSPRDPKNLTRREAVDDQLNVTAINMIHMAVTPKDRAHIRSLKTAKEAWNKLDKIFLANESIQSSRFDEVNNMAENFVMNEGESPEEMYRCLIALAVQMQDLGATFVDDLWIKKKFYNALLPWSGNKKQNSRPRSSCYNSGDKSHFVANFIYERRDVNGGYLIRKSKFRCLPKGLSKLASNNDVIKISSTEKPRTNMLGDQGHLVEKERLEKKEELELISLTQAYEEEVCMCMTLEASALILKDFNNSLISQLIKDRDYALGWVDKLKAKKCYLEENHEWSLEDVATFAKKKEDEGPNSCCDKLLDEVCFLREHNAKFLEVISTQEKALDEYYRLSKEKERIYNEVYGAKEFNCCPQYSINMDKLNSNLEYFGEALEICDEQGPTPLTTFSHNYSKEVICQFYATAVFLEDEGGFRS